MNQTQENALNVQQAPACYGSISCFAMDSVYCQACPAFVECQAQSLKTVESIRNIVNVDDLIRGHRKARESKKQKSVEARKAIETPKAEATTYGQPKLPTVVERASKVEKVVFEVTEQDEKIVMTLPVKAQPFAITLIKAGLINDIRAGLKSGTNAIINKKPVWLAQSVELLLKGSFTRAELKSHLVASLGWGDASAASHVSLAIALFCKFEIAKEESGEIHLIP